MTPVCIPKSLQERRGHTLKEKNLLPLGTNSFLLEYDPFQMGAKTILAINSY